MRELLPLNGVDAMQGMTRPMATAISLGAYGLPYALSRSTSPTPDHPGILRWYKSLRSPAIQPPDIAIPLAWVAIESGLAVASYRLLRKPASPARTRALVLLAANVFSIGAWSRLFFGSRNLPASTAAAAAMVAIGVAYTAEAKQVDRGAAAPGVPLVLWVSFATVLTAAIWRRNR